MTLLHRSSFHIYIFKPFHSKLKRGVGKRRKNDDGKGKNMTISLSSSSSVNPRKEDVSSVRLMGRDEEIENTHTQKSILLNKKEFGTTSEPFFFGGGGVFVLV